MTQLESQQLELWGGVECTVNRVHDRLFEQLHRLGHTSRISDLELFSDLGITSLRQPVLWESVAPNGLDHANWEWPDRWLERLRDLRIRPIVGLVHHGSGPAYTNLLDPAFPEKLARYAEAVAKRYPWVTDYTPVNEPLTTARFSALYGHWYPHLRSDRDFIRALLTQCKAVVLSMAAIRKVNPAARLIQTDDLGKVFSTPRLRYQAEFENERRWLSFDLLCGNVTHAHPLWGYLNAHVTEAELLWFAENAMAPDILGFNYYLTSERFLDDQVQHYPPHLSGGNGRDHYVDTEAARVRYEGLAGVGILLAEAQERFGMPMAVTECHNGCTREEQLRWSAEVWSECLRIKSHGVDVRAVTLWSLLGAFDWGSLLTHQRNRYEPGVFDIRSPKPRPTALVQLAKSFSQAQPPKHPLLEVLGWWHRSERLLHGTAITDGGRRVHVGRRSASELSVRPLLITGATGTLGQEFARACEVRGIAYRLTPRSELDIANRTSVERALSEIRPWAIINTAGYVRVDDAEGQIAACFRENTDGPHTLAAACDRHHLRLVTFSSDLVFDGAKQTPYLESDTPNPLNIYGQTKLAAELCVLSASPQALVIRTSAFFGPSDCHNFLTAALRELESGKTFRAANDAIVSPTYVPDLVNHTLDLLIDGEAGIWHLANEGAISWYDFAKIGAELAGVETKRLVACGTSDLELAAPRPLYTPLASEKAWIMPALMNALERYAAARVTSQQVLRAA